MRKTKNILITKLYLIIWLFLAASQYSCESVLFIELGESEKLIVVNGAISPDSSIVLQISRTRHILDNAAINPLVNASVRIYKSGSVIGQLDHQMKGYYTSMDLLPETGTEYMIEVDNPGLPSVSARCIIPESVSIISIDTATVSSDVVEDDPYYYGYDIALLQFDLTLNDPAGFENFYLLDIEAVRSRINWRDTSVIIVDSLFYGGQWNYFPSDSSYTIGDTNRYLSYPDIITGDIIAEASTSWGTLFSDLLIDGKSYSLRGQVYNHQIASADSAVLTFRLHSISESYYKYLKSRQKHYEAREDYLAVPVIVFSNIINGTGFFGGYSTETSSITAHVHDPWDYEIYWY